MTVNWDWSSFHGSRKGLDYNRRDLEHVEAVMPLVEGRTLAVQAGGNLGIFPKRLAQDFEAVYTFEPDPYCFSLLCRNAREPNIVKFQAALGSHHGRIATSKKRRDGKPTLHEGVTHVSGPGILPMLTLDDLRLQAIDLLYLDIEGFELHALKGAFQTLENTRPVVVCEVNQHLAFQGQTKEELFEFLKARGYDHKMTIRSDEVFVKRPRIGALTDYGP